MIQKYLNTTNIYTNVVIQNKNQAFDKVFEALKNQGCIKDGYLEAMIQRDKNASVAIGSYLAIVHGSVAAENLIKKNGMCLHVLKEPILWDGNVVKVVLGLALVGQQTMAVMEKIGVAFANEAHVYAFYFQPNLTSTQVLN